MCRPAGIDVGCTLIDQVASTRPANRLGNCFSLFGGVWVCVGKGLGFTTCKHKHLLLGAVPR